MESQFWDVINAHPSVIIVVVIGGLLALSALVTALSKLHTFLGFKTKDELEEERLDNLIRDVKEMREELRERFKEQDKYDQELKESIHSVQNTEIMLLGDRVTTRSQYYLRIGYIPADEMVEYQRMYDTYKEIGGNHGVDQLFKKTVDNLPLGLQEDKDEDK